MGAVEPLVSRRTLLTAAAAVPLLSACGTSGPGESRSGGGTMEAWVLQDDAQNPIQQSAIDRFNKTSQTKIKLAPFGASSSSGYTDKLQVAMGTPQAPEILFNWGGGSIRAYVENGQLVDLTPELEKATAWRDAFLASVLDAGKIDGKYYGIPLRGMQPVLIFYNKTLFGEHNKQAPESYDDLLSLVDFFSGQGIQPFALGAKSQWPLLMWIEYLLDRLGGAEVFEKIAAEEEGAWRDPAMMKSLEEINSLVDRGAFGTNFGSVDYDNGQASLLLARGKAAMHLMGTWELTNLLDQHTKFAKNDLAFAPFPAIEDGTGDPDAVVGNPTNYFSINANASDKAAAIEFLKTEMASDAYVNDLLKAGDIPAVAGLEDRFSDSANPEFSAYVYELVQKAPSFTLSWDQALPDAYTDPLLTGLQKVFLGNMSPDDYISSLEAVK